MRIFSLQEWKSLWNLNKPPKSQRVPRWGLESDSSGYLPDEVDAYRNRSRVSWNQGRSGGSLPSSVRRERKAYADPSSIPTRPYQPEPISRRSSESSGQHRKAPEESPDGNDFSFPLNQVKSVRNRWPPATGSGKSDDSDDVIYATIQKKPSPEQRQLRQVVPERGSWHKSRSHHKPKSPVDDMAWIDNALTQTPAVTRPLAKEPIKSWGRNKNDASAARRTSTGAIDQSETLAEPADARNLDEEQSRVRKFSGALRMFQQLEDTMKGQQPYQSTRRSGFCDKINGSEGPNVPLRKKFSSQPDVADRAKVKDIYKSTAALPMTGGVESSDEERPDSPTPTSVVLTNGSGVQS